MRSLKLWYSHSNNHRFFSYSSKNERSIFEYMQNTQNDWREKRKVERSDKQVFVLCKYWNYYVWMAKNVVQLAKIWRKTWFKAANPFMQQWSHPLDGAFNKIAPMHTNEYRLSTFPYKLCSQTHTQSRWKDNTHIHADRHVDLSRIEQNEYVCLLAMTINHILQSIISKSFTNATCRRARTHYGAISMVKRRKKCFFFNSSLFCLRLVTIDSYI